MAVDTGLTIGKYELGKKLGQGGVGSVFVARDTSLDREVALKFMHAEHTANADILRRFLQEARSAAKVVHPGIVTVFECSQVLGTGTSDDGVAYIAMELLMARAWRAGWHAAVVSHRPLRSRSHARSHRRSRPRTTPGSSIAISSPTTSSSSRIPRPPPASA